MAKNFIDMKQFFLYVLPLNVAILNNISLRINLKLCWRLCTPEKKGENGNQRNYNLATKILGLVTSVLLNEKVNFEPYHYSGGQWGSPKNKEWEGYRRQERRKWETSRWSSRERTKKLMHWNTFKNKNPKYYWVAFRVFCDLWVHQQ